MRLHLCALLVAAGGLCVLACEESGTIPGAPLPIPGSFAFVTTTDLSTGRASAILGDSTLVVYKNVQNLSKRAIARYYQDRIYVVNRTDADNIQVLDVANSFDTMEQFSTGTGSDPHDIVFFARNRAFVTRYNTDQLWIVDPAQGKRTGQIDFAWIADADGMPEMDRMVLISNRVFVSIRRLNQDTDNNPVDKSYIAVFHPSTELFIDADPVTPGTQPIELVGTNPVSELVINTASGMIWVCNAGVFGVRDGGLEVIDPVALTTSGVVLDESTVSGDLVDVVAIDANRGAAIVSDDNANTLLIGFDLSAPASIDTIYAPGTPSLADAELSTKGRIFLSDRSLILPGIRIYRADNFIEVTTTPADVGLPPSDIEFAR